MKSIETDIIMWTEDDQNKQVRIISAMASSTELIRKAAQYCKWEGNELILWKECPEAYHMALYFWLSGYGDAMEGRPTRETSSP